MKGQVTEIVRSRWHGQMRPWLSWLSIYWLSWLSILLALLAVHLTWQSVKVACRTLLPAQPSPASALLQEPCLGQQPVSPGSLADGFMEL